MKGDFSRIRFDAANRFSRVLQQQGRVMLDAEANEQTEILLHYLRTLARDLIGDYGGPIVDGGFVLTLDGDRLAIGAGRYYVHGILCESDGTLHYAEQPEYPLPQPGPNGSGGDPFAAFLASKTPTDARWWLYLDVRERHVTALEDERLREIALGGPDTCTRTKVVWQVRAREVDEIVQKLDARKQALQTRIADIEAAGGDASAEKAQLERIERALETLRDDPANACAAPLEDMLADGGAMTARLTKDVQPKTPCIVAPDARYRGAENQLYRIEIHRGGAAGQATFKWSRDNGSVATRWLKPLAGRQVKVADARGFAPGAWVELTDDTREFAGGPGVLVRVAGVDDDTLTLDEASVDAAKQFVHDAQRHPLVRLWNQQGDELADGVPVLATNPQDWIALEDGIQVRFDPDGDYATGDWWTVTARVAGGADGGIDWPDGAAPRPPRRVEHHYAPLGWAAWTTTTAGAARRIAVDSCLCTLKPLTPCQAARVPVDRRNAAAGGGAKAAAKPAKASKPPKP